MDSAPLAAIYNAAPIILWVEDELTKQYLDIVWQRDQRIQMYIGGGHETLEALVEDAYRAGRECVFSLRDRDFGPTNRARWTDKYLHKFSLESFEIECFLCDAAALAGVDLNTASRTQAEIEEWLTTRAQDALWWMACRKVISDLRQARQEDFWKHPKRSQVADQAAAEQILMDSPWRNQTVPALSGLLTAASLRQQLLDAHTFYAGQLQAEAWIPHFSCKEVFGDLVSWVYTVRRPAGEAGKENLAKAVAQRQVQDQRVPQELVELKTALLSRLGAQP